MFGMLNMFGGVNKDVKDVKDAKDETIKLLQAENSVLKKQLEDLIRIHESALRLLKMENEDLKTKLKIIKFDSEVYRSLVLLEK